MPVLQQPVRADDFGADARGSVVFLKLYNYVARPTFRVPYAVPFERPEIDPYRNDP